MRHAIVFGDLVHALIAAGDDKGSGVSRR
jgi:hypothetical protein